MRIDPSDIARRLVLDRFPQARAAWLGGSTALGTTTPTSDLDITVLLPAPPAPYRESLLHNGRPVELFVQTEESIAYFRAAERAARPAASWGPRGRDRIAETISPGMQHIRCAVGVIGDIASLPEVRTAGSRQPSRESPDPLARSGCGGGSGEFAA